MFVNALVARLGISIEDFRPVFELMPKSLQELILSYFEQITATPSFSPLLIGDAADAVFPVEGGAFDHAHGRRHLPRRGAPPRGARYSAVVRDDGRLSADRRVQLCACRRWTHAARLLRRRCDPCTGPRGGARHGLLDDDRHRIRVPYAVQPHRPEPASRVPRGLAGGTVFAGGMGASCRGAFRSMWTIWRGIPCFTARSRRSSCS